MGCVADDTDAGTIVLPALDATVLLCDITPRPAAMADDTLELAPDTPPKGLVRLPWANGAFVEPARVPKSVLRLADELLRDAGVDGNGDGVVIDGEAVELKAVVGRGSFSTVSSARIGGVEELCAIKWVVDSASKPCNVDDDVGCQALLAEVRTLRSLRHRNIVRFHGFCYAPGKLGGAGIGLAMEYVVGGSLNRRLHSSANGVLDWPSADPLFTQIRGARRRPRPIQRHRAIDLI